MIPDHAVDAILMGVRARQRQKADRVRVVVFAWALLVVGLACSF